MSEDDEERWVCHHCVGEAYLKSEIKAASDRKVCAFCGKKAAAIELGELAERVERAFADHFMSTDRDPDGFEYAMHKDPEISYSWSRSGEDVATTIAELLNADEAVALAVQESLSGQQSLDDQAIGEEDPFGDEAHYAERGPDDEKYQALWYRFETSLKTRSRFYNADAKALFDDIFKGLDGLASPEGKRAVAKAAPNSFPPFYRARIAFESRAVDQYLQDPERELGAPPSAYAKSGRMNAHGISVFYGAFEQATCIAELRPPVGSQIIVAKFSIVRELRLLDLDVLTTLSEKGSMFDPEYRERLDRIAFLRNLRAHVTRPTMPGEEELGYLPTQAFAEYLANIANPKFDGLLFRSTQTGHTGRNIVLFDDAAKVEKVETIKTRVFRSTGDPDDPDDDLSIHEQVGDAPSKQNYAAAHSFLDDDFYVAPAGHFWPQRKADPKPGLKLDRDGIEVHDVRACEYRTRSQKIRRHRSRSHSLAPTEPIVDDF
jgi:hypothetical protein